MSWTAPINYPGRTEDVVGQIIGPNAADEHYIITEAVYDPFSDMTRCEAGLMARGSESHVSIEAQEAYTLLRGAQMTKMLGHNPRADLLPVAFRKPHEVTPTRAHARPAPMLPGAIGRELVSSGV